VKRWTDPYEHPYEKQSVDELAELGGRGDVRAYVAAALRILQSDRIKHSANEAITYIQRAARKGDPLGLYMEGALKRQGELMPRDRAGAHDDFEYAAKKKFVPAISSVAADYLMGSGVPIDFNKARELAADAVDAGDIMANQLLGRIYKEGLGVPPDADAAFVYFSKAGDAGDPVAQYDMARAYYFGEGVAKDLRQAYRFARSAYCGKVKPAALMVSREYFDNSDSVESVTTGIRILDDLAADGDGDACLVISDIYLSSKYNRKDPNKAIIYLRCAANAGLVKGKYLYGATLLRYGKNHDDFTLAERYLTDAANNGNADAAYDLGVAYQRGTELQGDAQKARHWLKIAAEYGNDDAARMLKAMDAQSK
jgi:TPR repeat protein